MRIMTVRQPWAWAIIHGGKDVENRVRNIAGGYRGPVAIHVGLKFDRSAPFPGPAHMREVWAEADFDYGFIIGVVDLVDVHHPGEHWFDCVSSLPCSVWAEPDAYHLVLANPRPLSEPIPYKGALGLREVPADLLARIEAAL